MRYPSREAAYKAGVTTIKALKAEGFRGLTPKNIKVWENMGWHTCILHVHFGLYVRPAYSFEPGNVHYSLLANPNGHGSGRMGWNVQGGLDLTKMFKEVMTKAKEEAGSIQKCIKDIRAVMPRGKGKPCGK